MLKKIKTLSSFPKKGQTFILVVIFLLVGSLMITPFLSFMSTGMKTSAMYKTRVDELYAADAGITEAIWNMKQGNQLPSSGESLNLTLLSENVNNQTRNVTVYCQDKYTSGGVYKITSTATSTNGKTTTINAWVDTMPAFWDFATVTTSTINLQPGAEINGRASGTITGDGEIYGKTYPPRELTDWPDTQVFRDFYWTADVASNILPATIDVRTMQSIGPGHSLGNVSITQSTDLTVFLNGTAYINGNLTLAENQEYTLDLNYQTIFVDGDLLIKPGRPLIQGSGCIIAVGDITYQPNVQTGEDDFIYLMSLEGQVYFAPQNETTFYGCVAAQDFINGQPNANFSWNEPPIDKLNFPSSSDGVDSTIHIRTWEIN